MKTFLVSGANRGIGLAIVQRLSKENPESKILLGSRILADGKEAAANINTNVIPVELDLSNKNTLNNSINNILKEHSAVDVLINNAGVLENKEILEIEPETLEKVFHINVSAALTLMQAFLPGMIQKKYGRIVNVSSGWGSIAEGLSGPFSYSWTKACLNSLTITASKSIDSSFIKINSMCPGWVKTRMGGKEALRTPEQGADTAVWLATLDQNGPTGGFFRDRKPIQW